MVSSNVCKHGLGRCADITTTSELRDIPNANISSFVEVAEAKSLLTTSRGTINCNLVYTRRKHDSEQSNPDKNRTTFQQQAAGDKKAQNSLAAATTTRSRICENEQAMEYWNARFAQLHNYLLQYDTSDQQEVYLQSEFLPCSFASVIFMLFLIQFYHNARTSVFLSR